MRNLTKREFLLTNNGSYDVTFVTPHDGRTHVLKPGESLKIPAAVPHGPTGPLSEDEEFWRGEQWTPEQVAMIKGRRSPL
ncbi:hypothetical protein EV286_107545 [Rhizobium sp. BK251]|nr:hypothetical protein EV286_107545 [Rhizobium sp. BK251]